MNRPHARPPWHIGLAFVIIAAIPVVAAWWLGRPRDEAPPPIPDRIQDWFYAWWDGIPAQLRDDEIPEDEYSNIAPDDYVGPETCGNCHQENYKNWSHHPHRWMNAEASAETVKGRFDGSALQIRGGTATMYQQDDGYWMRLQRRDHLREFRITHTIGSRLQQYYVAQFQRGEAFAQDKGRPVQSRRSGAVGSGVEDFEPDTKVVLPVGFRLAHDQWAPTYSVLADNDTDFTPDHYDGFQPTAYYDSCAKCHTTMPQGYRMILDNNSVGLSKPQLHFGLRPFFEETLDQMTDSPWSSLPHDALALNDLVRDVSTSFSPQRAVTVGISCEACHYGGAAHVESDGEIPPRFFPSSPHLLPVGNDRKDYGRSHQNVNLLCAQCHSATRPMLPGGPAAVNSAEYRDAISGACYSQLSCINCHEPHTAIGPAWAETPDQDDASCIACHDHYESTPARAAHTRHRAGSPGSRCMNCHMPKINEGIEDMVRTHQISSPTKPEPIYAGGANACNVCHLDKSIDWTLGYLADWYGAQFDQQQVAKVYMDRSEPLGRAWLRHRNSAMRMVTIGAAKRAGANWLASELVEELDDVHLINRQFAQDTLESVLGIDLEESGYSYWFDSRQRKAVLDEVRARVTKKPGF